MKNPPKSETTPSDKHDAASTSFTEGYARRSKSAAPDPAQYDPLSPQERFEALIACAGEAIRITRLMQTTTQGIDAVRAYVDAFDAEIDELLQLHVIMALKGDHDLILSRLRED